MEFFDACRKLVEHMQEKKMAPEFAAYHMQRFAHEIAEGETPAMALSLAKAMFNEELSNIN